MITNILLRIKYIFLYLKKRMCDSWNDTAEVAAHQTPPRLLYILLEVFSHFLTPIFPMKLCGTDFRIPDSPTHTYHQSSTLQIHPHRNSTDATFSSDLFDHVVVMLHNAVSCPSLCYEQETHVS